MTYSDFLHEIIERGITAAKADYKDNPAKLSGAIAGFSECRGKDPTELRKLLCYAEEEVRKAFPQHDELQYWTRVCFHGEVQWVCNVVSAILLNEGHTPIITPTCRAMMLAHEIVSHGGEPQ